MPPIQFIQEGTVCMIVTLKKLMKPVHVYHGTSQKMSNMPKNVTFLDELAFSTTLRILFITKPTIAPNAFKSVITSFTKQKRLTLNPCQYLSTNTVINMYVLIEGSKYQKHDPTCLKIQKPYSMPYLTDPPAVDQRFFVNMALIQMEPF